MRRLLLALALGGLSLTAGAQTAVPVGVDLFSDRIVVPLNEGPKFSALDIGPIPTPGYEHALVFQDGRQLSGTLVELNAEEVVWRRPDMTPDLRVSRREIRRIQCAPAPTASGYETARMAEKEQPKRKDAPVTVKLAGGDWLFGDARSADGQEFSMALAPNTELKFSRAAVEWMHFGSQAVPAFGFSGEALEMENWITGNVTTPGEVVDGEYQLAGNGWVGREISPPERFVIDFETPDAVEPLRLWLQPFQPSPNSYSTGTVELSFSQNQLGRLIFFNRFAREQSPMPQEENASGRARYRVFYDSPGERLAVMRGDALVGEWKLREEEAANARAVQSAVRMPRSFCFNRTTSNKPLVLSRFRIQPWDGKLPKAGETPQSRLVAGGEAKPGTLEGLTGDEIVFAGETRERNEGIFVDFAQVPAGLKGAEAIVSFGARGEMVAAGLEIREGRARGRTAAIKDLDLPVGMIQAIIFPKQKVEDARAAGVLVFRNGDSLGGRLIETGKGASVRWRAENGQELTLEAIHVAGARIGNQPAEAEAGATVELMSGDRLRGQVISLEKSEFRFRHKALGERVVARSLLKTMFPSTKAMVLDAGAEPEVWLGLIARVKPALISLKPAGNTVGRVFLDGNFIGPPTQRPGSSNTSISRVIEKPERYELRCEVTDAGGAEPYLSGSIAGNQGTPTVQMNVGNGQLRVYSYNMTGVGGRMQQQEREVRLSDKLPTQRSRRELRVFVDSKAGTIDYMVDGVHLLRFGQQATERAPGVGTRVSLSAYSFRGNICILSNVKISPWNGDVPRPGEAGPGACLVNGDAATGAPGVLVDGKIAIGSGADAIDIPIERILSLDFGNTAVEEKPMEARIRLVDGTVINLLDYEWRENALRGASPALGKIELPAEAICELILAPPPPRFPMLAEPKKLATKDGEESSRE